MAASPLSIIITGSANGIGRHLAYTFLSSPRRHCVTALDLDSQSLGRLRAIFERQNPKLEDLDSRLLVVTCDVGDAKSVEDAVNQHVAAFGGVDVVINNASPAPKDFGKPVDGTGMVSVESFERSLRTGLVGPFLLSRSAAPYLKKSANKGRIINITSTRAHQSEPTGEGYAAAKGGLYSLTHSMAMSLSPHVLVNAIAPGWIDVRHLNTAALSESTSKDGIFVDVDPIPENEHRQQPVGRVGTPDDIAACVVFLAEEERGFLQGQEIVVDGGMTKRMIYDEIPQHL
ncbi:short-chain dehydrogenase/reductase SDR [Hyaloraphidium curvatum]|nr:short-chain dehydrogenase/reductase SDR [Hyaloraphidium curvatum]